MAMESTCSIVASPLETSHAASLRRGPRILLTMNPGTSLAQRTTSLPKRRPSETASATASSLVLLPRITSTRGIIGGGLKKWIPTNQDSLRVDDAISPIGRVLVFEAS